LSFRIAIEPGLIRVIMYGALTREDLDGIASAADDIERDRDPVPHRLADMTGVTEMQVAYPEVKTLAEHRRTIVFPNEFKSAIVIRTPVQRGMARMFQTLNDNPKITIQIFDDKAAALRWLGR